MLFSMEVSFVTRIFMCNVTFYQWLSFFIPLCQQRVVMCLILKPGHGRAPNPVTNN